MAAAGCTCHAYDGSEGVPLNLIVGKRFGFTGSTGSDQGRATSVAVAFSLIPTY